ncbi:hypothetical protein TWF696_001653 [Orbilia brochopaga]|uniref:Exonuclease domain-containing protein n=1 Tax=Orbilia brochopaga TaxID=3140254 RepID=A0AAV9U9S8_9PEZI
MPGLTTCSQPRWTDFSFTVEREEALKRLQLPVERYGRYGYRVDAFTHDELLHKYEAYCRRCSAFALKLEPGEDLAGHNSRSTCMIHPGYKLEKEKIWSCCRTSSISYPGEPSGCVYFATHDWTSDSPLPCGFWDLHPTPPFKPVQGSRSKRPRVAVSLDCEMATNRFNQPELIKLTLVDFFSREILIDSLVRPQAGIKNMLTSIHGIAYKDIAAAAASSKAILGRDAARDKIFEFVGPKTIVLVHGGVNDFLCLRWYHKAILDTQEVESRIKRIGDDELPDWLANEGAGLEAMCRNITGVHIRTGSGTHDSLEDAMACRELGIWYASNLKGEIGTDAQDATAGPASTECGRIDIPDTQAVQTAESSSGYAAVKTGTGARPVVVPGTEPTDSGSREQHWECKVCRIRVSTQDKLKHRVEKSHMERLIALVQQKGG